MLESVLSSTRRGLYIAEIGLNHNGSLETAIAMIEAAARAGADAVKFQTFVPELMNSEFTSDLLAGGAERRRDASVVAFFRRFVLTADQYRELMRAAARAGVVFFSSVFDLPSLELLEGLGVALYKLASSEVTNHPLIEGVARTGKPAVLSTGMATEGEIDAAVSLFLRQSRAELVLLHCVSLYPLPPAEANLARIPALAERFGLPVGFSDHTADAVAPALAAAMGARLFEKHFTIDRFHDCPDKEISCTPDEFQAMIDAVENALRMRGDGSIGHGTAEAATARAARRSLFACRTIPRGTVIAADDLAALRPGVGIPPSDIGTVLGRRCRVDVPEGYLIKKEYLE